MRLCEIHVEDAASGRRVITTAQLLELPEVGETMTVGGAKVRVRTVVKIPDYLRARLGLGALLFCTASSSPRR